MDALGHGRRAAAAAAAGDARSQTPVAAAIPGVLGGGRLSRTAGCPARATAVRRSRTLTAAPRQRPADRRLRRSRRSRPARRVADIRPMIPLGQFRDTFIIAVDDEGIAIIDQHVAHERVLFERVMERLTAGPLESQRLLVPLVLELPPAAHAGAGRPRGRARAARLRDRERSATARSR